MIKLYLPGIVLGAATLIAAVASAQDVDSARVSDEAPVASAAEPTPPHGVPPAPSPDPGRPSKSLNIDVKIDGNGFRAAGRLSGSKGVPSAWLGAQLRGDGVDGRLEGNDGTPRDFKLNMDLLPGWAKTAARLWPLAAAALNAPARGVAAPPLFKTAAASRATAVPSKKRGLWAPHSSTALAKSKSRKSYSVMRPSSTSSNASGRDRACRRRRSARGRSCRSR